MKYPDTLDTIVMIGCLTILFAVGVVVGTQITHWGGKYEQQLSDEALAGCQADRARCEGQRDLALAEGSRCADHLQLLKTTCGDPQ